MKRKTIMYIIGVSISYIFMLVWGCLIVDYFSNKSVVSIIGSIVIEVIAFIVMIVFCIKIRKIKRQNEPPRVPMTKQEKIMGIRSIFLLVSAFVLTYPLLFIGSDIAKGINRSYKVYFIWVFAICCISPIILTIANILLKKNYINKIKKKDIEELQQYIVSHREFAEKTSSKKLIFLKRWSRLTDLYSALFGIFAIGIALSVGVIGNVEIAVTFYFVSYTLLLCSFSRIRFPIHKSVFEEEKTYITEDEYPELYKVAKQAADTLHCSGEIRINVLANCNACIAKLGNIYSVQLGVILLCTFSKEELYNIFLHEFSHMTNNSKLLSNEEMPHYVAAVASWLYCYFYSVYSFQYSLYIYASSILHETNADKAMAQYGNATIAASALLKLKYYDLYTWENFSRDEYIYETEEPREKLLTNEIDSFRKAIKKRADDWNNLVDVEILAQNASHPTLKMRLDSLGVTDLRIIETENLTEFEAECKKALNHIEELIDSEKVITYDEDRESFYFEPKDKVDAWEEAGRPLIAEEYHEIDFALRQLGRFSDSIELCDRAIAELSGTLSSYAYFIKGCYLLHNYDKSGIDYVYKAIENNYNYINEGLNIIGDFCCLTGNQVELEIYRQRAAVLIQKYKDEYSQITILNKNDHLTSEQLTDSMLDEILSYIKSVDKGLILKIYLIRKIISDDLFTSAFIIKFVPLTKQCDQNELFYKICYHLRSYSGWQFSVFNYKNVSKVKFKKIKNSLVYSSK